MDDMTGYLDQARAALERQAWADARAHLLAADDAVGLSAADLERLARCEYLTGRADAAEQAWARAHTAFLDAGEVPAAVRCGFWLGLLLTVDRGDEVRGGGWFARAARLLDGAGDGHETEHGYLLLPDALRQLDAGEAQAARDVFVGAARIGEEHGEADLVALARLGQGQALLRLGEVDAGLRHLDEVMVTVLHAAVSPVAAGVVYCAVILACQQALDVRRAQQWTRALSDWCAEQRDLVPFRGQCLVHRSRLAQLRGDWSRAVQEAEHACRTLGGGPGPAAGHALYQRAELHRLRGELDLAERDYGAAAAAGHAVHPGLALLWLDGGRPDAAAAALRPALSGPAEAFPTVGDELSQSRSRAELLDASVEVLLATGDTDAADSASAELGELAARVGTPLVRALADRCEGSVLLAHGRASEAAARLAAARAGWLALDAPVEAARTRLVHARALRLLGDHDTAEVELDSARRVFEDVGAVTELRRLAELREHADVEGGDDAGHAGLTPREVEVVRLVATGMTNRQIADELVISDKTVARHLHNVFTKLDLANRSAATAYAYEHDLL